MSSFTSSQNQRQELFLRHLVNSLHERAVFALDDKGMITTWSSGSENLLGYSEEEVFGKHFSILFEENKQNIESTQNILTEVVRENSAIYERELTGKSGKKFFASLKFDLLKTETDNPLGFAVLVRDLTEKKLALKNKHELEKSEEIFNLLVSAVKDYAIFLMSPEGNILTWNEGAKRHKGYTSEEIIGRNFSTFYAKESVESGHPQWELEQAKVKGQYEEEGWRVRKDGSQFWASVSITAIFNKDGHLTGFVKVTRDLTERRKAELELRKAVIDAENARDEAERANRLKTEFVATISHEIRTPMSGLIGLAELLMHEPDRDELPEMAQRMFNSSRKLLDVLNSLLDFSKLESGKVKTENVYFSPKAVIDEVIGLVSPMVQAKSLSIETIITKNVPERIYADETKVRQVLNNLVHNAVKFTSHGRIRIKVDRKDINGIDSVCFSVSDTGIGIREEHKSLMFDPFVQADPSYTRRFGGTGLGLSICRHYTTLMQGEIGLKSTEGKGSTFWFSLPAKEQSTDE